jgi:hypothetical protein
MPLYESLIVEVIVWSDFTSTSLDRDMVIEKFINGEDSLLFQILLHPGDVAASIEDFSVDPNEKEVLIAASSGFIVEDVAWKSIQGLNIGCVQLSYYSSWYDFNIDDPPVPVLV